MIAGLALLAVWGVYSTLMLLVGYRHRSPATATIGFCGQLAAFAAAYVHVAVIG